MGLHYYFCAERLDGDLWVPLRLESEVDPAAHHADLAWAHRRDPVVTAFLGEPLSMTPGRPADAGASTFFRHYDRHYPADCLVDLYMEMSVHHASAAELLIDCWPEEAVLLTAPVEAQHAGSFGHGWARFPNAKLLEAGWAQAELDQLLSRAERAEGGAIDQRFGLPAHRRASVAPEARVPVTWSATISEMLGETRLAAFRRLEAAGPPDAIRVILYRA